MAKIKIYRFIRVMLGSRSFFMQEIDGTSYMLIRGYKLDPIIKKFKEDGWIEEWPKEKIGV